MIPALTSTVTHELLDQIYFKYHLVEEDGAVIPGATTIVDCHLPSKICFHFYYFEAGLAGSSSYPFVWPNY